MTQHTNTVGRLGDVELATMALAGVRSVTQGSVAPLTTAAASYTVTSPDTRRVMCFHLGATSPAAGDIRFRLNATATSAYMPLLPQKYATFELSGPRTLPDGTTQAAEYISFYNTSADTITVYVLEML